MNWKSMIDGCFGLEDRAFAEHPSDEQEAFELLTELRAKHVGWGEFSTELRRRLDKMPKLKTNQQIAKVKDYFRIWLLD